jgi:hypothetical protein
MGATIHWTPFSFNWHCTILSTIIIHLFTQNVLHHQLHFQLHFIFLPEQFYEINVLLFSFLLFRSIKYRALYCFTALSWEFSRKDTCFVRLLWIMYMLELTLTLRKENDQKWRRVLAQIANFSYQVSGNKKWHIYRTDATEKSTETPKYYLFYLISTHLKQV